MLFKMLDRQAWKESRHNPDKMLKELPAEILKAAAGDGDYMRHCDVVLFQFTKYMERFPVRCGKFSGRIPPGQRPASIILPRIFNACRNPDMGGRIAFVEDYGEQLAQYLVHGVHVWLNNPIPPMEASGTSGMKAAINGVPQLSILDGWWMEAYNGKNGWALGHEEIEGNRDQADATEMYRVLEEKIIPVYYKISDEGIPHDWVHVMKEAIKSTAAQFSARRMVKEYAVKFYSATLKNVDKPIQMESQKD